MASWRPNADGPDTSHYQHVTNEASVPAYGLASCKISEGAGYFDPTCPQWLALFERRKIPRKGVYHWLRTDSSISAQLANLFNRCRQVGIEVNGQLRPGFMIQLDWERTIKNGVPIRDPSVAEVGEFTAGIRARYGRRQITYVSDWVSNFYAWLAANPDEPLWYANYRLVNDSVGALAECTKYGATISQWTSTYKGGGIASGTPGQPETDRGYDMNHVFDWETVDRLCLIQSPIVVVPPPIEKPPPPPPPPTPERDELDMATLDELRVLIRAELAAQVPFSVITNREALAAPDGVVHAAGTLHWKLVLTHEPLWRAAWLAPWEHELVGWATGALCTNEQLKAIGEWFPPPDAPESTVPTTCRLADGPLEVEAVLRGTATSAGG